MAMWTERMAGRNGAGILAALGSVVGALGVASCCALPLAFAGLGLGGAWLAGLTVLAPYQPILLAATMLLLGAGFFLVYLRPTVACVSAEACAAPGAGRMPKIALWTASVLTVASFLVS